MSYFIFNFLFVCFLSYCVPIVKKEKEKRKNFFIVDKMTFLSFICFLYYTVILVQYECPSSVKKTKTKKTPLCYVLDDQFNPKYLLTSFISCLSDIQWLIQAAHLTAYFHFFNKSNHSLVSYDMILLAYFSVTSSLLGLQCILSNSAAISSGVLFLISGTLNFI